MMPQDLTNSQATFKRTMEKVMDGMNVEVIAFLNDLIIFSDTKEQHEEHLMKVLKRISDFGLKLSPPKFKYLQRSVKYLGHVISEEGIQLDPVKVEAIWVWPRPNTTKQLWSLLVFCGYYRWFVEHYSSIVRPLNDLLKGEPSTRKHKSIQRLSPGNHPLGERWTTACRTAFESLALWIGSFHIFYTH